MRQNILLYHDQDKETTLALKVSCANYSFVSYHMASDNTLVISENSVVPDSHRVSLVHQLKRLLKDLEVQSKVGSQYIQLHKLNIPGILNNVQFMNFEGYNHFSAPLIYLYMLNISKDS